MEVGWDQMVAVALLTIAAAVGIGTLLLALSLIRALIRWIVGAGVSNDAALKEPVGSSALLSHPVSASDLFAVRSNLDAVSRQLEDLERKLRSAPRAGSPSKGPPGKSERLTREPLVDAPWADAPLSGRPALDLSEPRFRRG
jgi:hypothetical protein